MYPFLAFRANNLLTPPDPNEGGINDPGYMHGFDAFMRGMDMREQNLHNRDLYDEDMRHTRALNDTHNMAMLQQIAEQNKKPNVVMPQMTPFQQATIGQKEKDRDLKSQMNQDRTDLGQQKNDIAAKRAAVYEFTKTHPNHIIKVGGDGITRAIDPQTNEVTVLGQTGMSQEDLENLKAGNRLDLAGVNNTARADMETQRETGNLNAIAARTAGTKEINAAKPQPIPKISDTQNRAKYQNNARMLLNKDPNKWGRIIQFDASGNPTIDPRHSNQQDIDEFNQTVYGSGGLMNQGPTGTIKTGGDPLGIRGGGGR